MFTLDSIVTVTPANLTEKNRIREHGAVWRVKAERSPLDLNQCLLISVATGHIRWFARSQLKPI